MRVDKPGFIRLADILLRQPVALPPVDSEIDPSPASTPSGNVSPAELLPSAETSNAIRAARVFHAALRDAFDAVLSDLVREVAVDVVARELRLADVDLARIASRVIAERLADEPLRVRVAPADAALCCELPVVVDPALEPGDVMLECRTGTIDARLGVRLAAVIAAVAG